MYQRIRGHFSPTALVLSVLAVVLALTGAAFAAGGGLSGKQKKEVTKIAKQYAGKPGAPGAAGANGKDGTNGKDGAPGAEGKEGPKGSNGTPGTNGKSVELGTEATGTANCNELGGTTVQVTGEPATKKIVCNGQTGFAETLPDGASEIGTWSVSIPATKEFYEAFTSISFPTPVSEAGKKFFFFTSEEVLFEEFGTSGCKWALFEENAKPESTEPGTLCLFAENAGVEYESLSADPTFVIPGTIAENGFGPTGTNLVVTKKNTEPFAESLHIRGAWAVSAP
jgi:hypothetical protein